MDGQGLDGRTRQHTPVDWCSAPCLSEHFSLRESIYLLIFAVDESQDDVTENTVNISLGHGSGEETGFWKSTGSL